MAKKKYHSGESMMINEDSSAFAHLPQQVISKKYPEGDYNNELYEQGREYQDKQANEMVAKAKKQKLNKHF